ncbi:hypothetical protein BST37_13995 [Mycobacterium noviomagense]|uniref:Uncharacterized protein n=1 Tax=Mycobacterium noviomagense TaxID=459858 RepID=A0ABX3T355_9MYCO|nr:hypothetical protein BST37_13995 [Mycobacterium noviomagense]
MSAELFDEAQPRHLPGSPVGEQLVGRLQDQAVRSVELVAATGAGDAGLRDRQRIRQTGAPSFDVVKWVSQFAEPPYAQ